MPYEDECFDGIIDSAMINANTLDNIRAILNGCYRVLKVGGRVFSTGLFKIGMTGYNSGIMLEENTYKDLVEGPLAHRGTVHFFSEEQIYDLWTVAGFKHIMIDSVSRSDRGGIDWISYFIAEAEK